MAGHVKRHSRMIMKRLLLMGLIVVSVGNTVAHAAANEGPIHVNNNGAQLIRNTTVYGNPAPTGRNWDYAVSFDDYTDILETDILVYSTTPTVTIDIIGSDLCLVSNPGVRSGDVVYAPARPIGTAANTYQVYTYNRAGGDIVTGGIGYGRWNNTPSTVCRGTTVTLTASGSPLDPGIGMYVYRVNALANVSSGGKFSNSFHIEAPPGSIVTQSSKPPFSDFGMQASYPIPASDAPYYSEIDIPFGPDCTLTTQTATKSFYLMDPDNGSPTQPSVQPLPMAVSVQRFTRSTGAYRGTAPLTWVDVGAGFAQHEGGNIWRPLGSNQTTVRFDFTADQDEIYYLRLSRVYYNNTLQFRLPYDGGYYYRECQRPTTVRPVVSMTPNPAENGVTLTGDSHIQNVGNSVVTSQVNYTRRVWSDTNRNGAYDAGESVFGGTPQSGAVTVPAGSGSYDFPDWSEVADTGIHGGRICISLAVSAAAPVTVQAPTTAVSCADIGKKPKLHVATGDVFVGGTFRNSSGVCPIQTVNSTTLQLRGSVSVIGGITYGSYADYAAFNLGPIVTFGANTVPQGSGGIASNLTFGNTPLPFGHFFSNNSPADGNPTRARCLNDPFALFSAKATPSSGSSSYDVSSGSASLTSSGVVTLNASSPLPAGRKTVVYAPNASAVIIGSNMTYAEGPYAAPEQIPQLVILSNAKITVREAVTRLDGIYATKGDFETCDVAPTLTRCNTKLEVNGAVIVGNQVKPYRTFGAQKPNYSEKAEVFRLRPDILLDQLPGPGTPTDIRTVNQREVPPRF